MVKKEQNIDKEDLWGKITKTVNPIKSDKISPANIVIDATSDTEEKIKAKPEPDRFFVQPDFSMYQIAKNIKNIPSDLRNKEAFGIDGGSSKKLRAGKFDLDATLDLHGMTQHIAFLSLQNFIKTCVAKKYRTVLIITGKGTDGRGILRNKLPIWLKSEECAQHVVAFDQAKAKDGGGGAFYIRLRRDRHHRS